MSTADRRRATRISLEVPAAVMGHDGAIRAEVRDVSVSGVKVFIDAELLGLSTPPDLLEAALAVKSAFASTFTVKLDHGRPTEIERTATMARLVLPSYEPDCIELGCMFEQPLTPDELNRLCGASPKLGSSDRRSVPRVERRPPVEAPPEPQDAPAETARPTQSEPAAKWRRQKSPFRVFITVDGEEKQLLCHSTALDRKGLHVRASDAAIGAEDAAEAALLFARRYGTEISVKIMDGVRHLWTGPARVLGMEILFDRPGDLLLTVAFARELRQAEIERLGLATRVA